MTLCFMFHVLLIHMSTKFIFSIGLFSEGIVIYMSTRLFYFQILCIFQITQQSEEHFLFPRNGMNSGESSSWVCQIWQHGEHSLDARIQGGY
jgi:hypothetical protein